MSTGALPSPDLTQGAHVYLVIFLLCKSHQCQQPVINCTTLKFKLKSPRSAHLFNSSFLDSGRNTSGALKSFENTFSNRLLRATTKPCADVAPGAGSPCGVAGVVPSDPAPAMSRSQASRDPPGISISPSYAPQKIFPKRISPELPRVTGRAPLP